MQDTTYCALAKCPLFGGIDAPDTRSLLTCLSARTHHYEKNESVLAAGARISHIGVVLAGSVHIGRDDYWGNHTILAHLGPGELFGEALCCAGVDRAPINVTSVEPTDVMLLDYQKVLTSCSSACVFHARLVQNMVRILAQKNVALTQKMEAITQRTTREKLLTYLSQQAKARGKSEFEIPFNRQELADYLAVERSAMSKELSNMQGEGLVRYHKNRFALL